MKKQIAIGLLLVSQYANGTPSYTIKDVSFICMGYANGYVSSFKEHNDAADLVDRIKLEKLQMDKCVDNMLQAEVDGLIEIVPEANL